MGFECSNKSRILVPSLGLFCFCLFVCLFCPLQCDRFINLIIIFCYILYYPFVTCFYFLMRDRKGIHLDYRGGPRRTRNQNHNQDKLYEMKNLF